MMQQGKAYWAHCGDSRMYHFRGTRTMSVSSDHSLVAELVRQRRLDDRAALRHPQRNVPLSCLAATASRASTTAATSPRSPATASCCAPDGLWAHFTDFELASTLQEFPARAAAERLVARPRACRRQRRQHLAGDRQVDRGSRHVRRPAIALNLRAQGAASPRPQQVGRRLQRGSEPSALRIPGAIARCAAPRKSSRLRKALCRDPSRASALRCTKMVRPP